MTIVTAAVPGVPSLVAVIVAVPAATAVTRPLELTVALVRSDVVHVIVRLARISLFAPSVVAVNCRVSPANRDGVEGDTDTEVTGGGAVTGAGGPALVSERAHETIASTGRASPARLRDAANGWVIAGWVGALRAPSLTAPHFLVSVKKNGRL